MQSGRLGEWERRTVEFDRMDVRACEDTRDSMAHLFSSVSEERPECGVKYLVKSNCEEPGAHKPSGRFSCMLDTYLNG